MNLSTALLYLVMQSIRCIQAMPLEGSYAPRMMIVECKIGTTDCCRIIFAKYNNEIKLRVLPPDGPIFGVEAFKVTERIVGFLCFDLRPYQKSIPKNEVAYSGAFYMSCSEGFLATLHERVIRFRDDLGFRTKSGDCRKDGIVYQEPTYNKIVLRTETHNCVELKTNSGITNKKTINVWTTDLEQQEPVTIDYLEIRKRYGVYEQPTIIKKLNRVARLKWPFAEPVTRYMGCGYNNCTTDVHLLIDVTVA